jgi:hypothetical protein
LRSRLLVELGDWRLDCGEVERRIILLGTTLAADGRVLETYVGQTDVGVAFLGLARRLRWSGGYDFWVDGWRR